MDDVCFLYKVTTRKEIPNLCCSDNGIAFVLDATAFEVEEEIHPDVICSKDVGHSTQLRPVNSKCSNMSMKVWTVTSQLFRKLWQIDRLSYCPSNQLAVGFVGKLQFQ